ncbi:MAG: ketoacyl-ACP synthase III [Actinobacteria bacterium]|nr:ketoacyl-ACP synthase III [Actinomycetota bacterium]
MTATDGTLVRSTTVAPAAVAPATDPTVLPVAITGLGAYLPARTVDNDELSRTLDTSDAWIRTRTGIATRHVAAPEEATSDLALAAARAALADAGVDAADLRAIVVATCTPDHLLPATGPLVAAGLGVEVPAFDLNAACSGFVYGLRVAGALAATADGPVLLIGAEALTRIVDAGDRGTAILFGDGAAAVVLTAHAGAGLGPFDLGSDGSDPSMLWAAATGTRSPATPARLAAGEQYLTMRGGDVYRHAVTRMTASATAVLSAAGVTIDDVDLFVGHQANARILAGVAERLGLPAGRSHVTIDRHGNTSAASVPLALVDARDTGRLGPGDRVLVAAFGAGLTWGSTLLTWEGRRRE